MDKQATNNEIIIDPTSRAALASKGVYHVNIAKQYFEMAALQSSMETKKGLRSWCDRLNFIELDYLNRVDEDTKEVFRREVLKGDTIFFDAFTEKLLGLNSKKRQIAELFIDGLLRDEVMDFELAPAVP